MLPAIAVLAITDSLTVNAVGAATVIGPDLLITCAHVLREGGYSSESGTSVRLRIQGISGPLTASLVAAPWIEKSSSEWPSNENLPPRLDIVALRLAGKVDGLSPVLRSLNLSDAGTEMSSFGFPASQPEGREAYGRMPFRQDMRGLYQLEAIPNRFPIETGFSGGPVFDANLATVGVVVLRWRPGTDDPNAPQAGFMIPLSSISALFQEYQGPTIKVESPLSAKYRKAQDLTEWASERMEENPYGKRRTSPFLPLLLAVPKDSGRPDDAFSKIERLHIGDDPQSETLFDFLEPLRILAPDDSHHYYIQAPGGAGKTFFLYELLNVSTTAGKVPFFINAMRAGSSIGKVFEKETTADQLKILFELSKPKIGFRFFDQATRANDPVLLIIDGLNEVSAEAQQIVRLISGVVADYDKVQIVMTDRMTFRSEYSDSFILATISPLTPDFVNRTVGTLTGLSPDYRRLLRLPFFLDLAREKDDTRSGTRSALILKYVEFLIESGAEASTGKSTTKQKMLNLARVAFGAYQDGKQELNQGSLKKIGEPGAIDAAQLVSAGLLRQGRSSTSYIFRHQLIHDCLAAYHYLENKLPASPANLNTLTFARRSSDTLGFVLGNLERDNADDFIVNVYDWDWGMTLSCLVETDNKPYGALAKAICAAISEKLDDTFLHTRQRPRARLSALQRFLSMEGDTFSVREIPARIRQCETEFQGDRLRRWWLAFTPETPNLDVWQALIGTDPLAGWSAASTLRRIAKGEAPVFEKLEILYYALWSQPEARPHFVSLRWRIIHVMGRFQSAIPILMKVGFEADEDPDVRYGAIREVVEIATQQDETGARKILSEALDKLNSEGMRLPVRTLSAFRNCAILQGRADKEPPWWRGLYRPLLQRASEIARDVSSDDSQWVAQLERFEANERDASD